MKKNIDQQILLDKITSLASEDDDIEVIWLYGSRSQGSYHSNSDFDLAVAFKNFDLSVNDKFLRPNLLTIEWAYELGIEEDKLSIVDVNTIPIYLAFNVVEYGTVLYQADTTRCIHEANRIYSQYEYQLIESQQND